MAGSARTTRTIQARGQLSRHHSGPCPRDDADEALQIFPGRAVCSEQPCTKSHTWGGLGRELPDPVPLADDRRSCDSLFEVMVARRQESKVRRDASAGAPRRHARRNHDQAPTVKDPEASRTLKATAYHEAGHVVASHLEMLPLRPVTTLRMGKRLPLALTQASSADDISNGPRRRTYRVSKWNASSLWHWLGRRRSGVSIDAAHGDPYLKLLALRADGLLNKPFVWNQVAAVAGARLAEKTIRSGRLEKIILTAHENAVRKTPGRTPHPSRGLGEWRRAALPPRGPRRG